MKKSSVNNTMLSEEGEDIAEDKIEKTDVNVEYELATYDYIE